METPQLLPDNILQKQVCQECFQYLSVPPILTNSRGETICGRCVDESGRSQFTEYTKSYFNVIAEKFLFKCTNHFNGCIEVLSLDGMKEHEEICSFKKKQECFFCSFSGNLSQIVNHSLIFHSGNVSFDGIFSFWLDDSTFQKKFILLVDGGIFHVAVDTADDLFTAIISPAAKTSSSDEFGVQFFQPDHLLYFNFKHTDYGLLGTNLNCYKKNIAELFTLFQRSKKVCCRILVERFSMDVKQIEFQKRFAKLRLSENIILAQEKTLSSRNNAYNAAMDVIKKMSYNLFKCCSCQKITFKDTYYCLQMHFYCKKCLTNMCKVCDRFREFKKLENIDNLTVTCDWPRCMSYLKIEDYWAHIRSCRGRPYKCPLQDCRQFVFSADELIDHWHSEVPKLVSAESIKCKKFEAKEYYWLINYDLYRVMINFSKIKIHVLIDEVNVLPHNISFKCKGGNSIGYQDLTSSVFCGKYNINTQNSISFPNNPATYICTKLLISTV